MGGKANSAIVVGGGIWGLACAHACTTRGWSVTVLEARKVGAGASGGIVGAMAPHTPDQWNPKKQFQFEALDTAEAFWSAIEVEAGRPSGFGRTGRWQPILTEAGLALAQARSLSAAALWQGRHHWRIAPRPKAIPEASAPFGVIHDTLSARLHPAAATAALARACRARGVVIEEGVAVTGLDQQGVRTEAGARSADAVVLASGHEGFELLAPYTPKHPGRAQKGQAALLGIDLGGHPQVYADGLYVVPHADGTTAVGSTSENTFDNLEPDCQLDDLIGRAATILPALAGAPVLTRWAGLRPKPRRRDPMLGPIPGLPRHFAALGAFKIGFGLAHRVGAVLADCLEGPADIPDSFSIAAHMR